MDDPLNLSRLDDIEAPGLYHTDTRPISHKLTDEERARYEAEPPLMVGKHFVPGNGDYLWEIVEVAFSKVGWSSVVLNVEGQGEKRHKMVLENFIEMLKNGMVEIVDE